MQSRYSTTSDILNAFLSIQKLHLKYFQIYITIMTDNLSSLSFSRYREISPSLFKET
nr:MAG TPA: hypothetical protein [Caudoviricetes sp.]